jgi:hypothetical protein
MDLLKKIGVGALALGIGSGLYSSDNIKKIEDGFIVNLQLDTISDIEEVSWFEYLNQSFFVNNTNIHFNEIDNLGNSYTISDLDKDGVFDLGTRCENGKTELLTGEVAGPLGKMVQNLSEIVTENNSIDMRKSTDFVVEDSSGSLYKLSVWMYRNSGTISYNLSIYKNGWAIDDIISYDVKEFSGEPDHIKRENSSLTIKPEVKSTISNIIDAVYNK